MSKLVADYPDISDIIRRKSEGRRDIAARTWGQKIARMEELRERVIKALEIAPPERVERYRRYSGSELQSGHKPVIGQL